MDTIETLIPDNKGNHLVVVLYFYDNANKLNTFQIPPEFHDIEIADININKLDIHHPLSLSAFNRMCDWLIEQFLLYPHSIFSFICSLEPLTTHHNQLSSEQYRWSLFEILFKRNISRLEKLGIHSKKIIVGKDDYQTDARVFYRDKHAPIVHIVESHIKEKYGE